MGTGYYVKPLNIGTAVSDGVVAKEKNKADYDARKLTEGTTKLDRCDAGNGQ